MQGLFAFLARRPWAGIGLALLVEAAILVALGRADPAAGVGIPAAVAAAIAGTVAVVFGPWNGAFVALVGAIVFVLVGDSGAGELAALAVWPAVVVAAGIFARRVSRQRAAFRRIIAAQELERQRLALELHDGTAQTLAAALLTLQRAEAAATSAEVAAVNAELRELIREAVESVRALAVDLRPRVLDDFGLCAAIDRLVATFSERTGIAAEVDLEEGSERLPPDAELALFRIVQEGLADIAARADARAVQVRLERRPGSAVLVVQEDGRGVDPHPPDEMGWVGARERLRLLGGRLTVASAVGSGTTLTARLPTSRRVVTAPAARP
jgi:signal transduction histidine kinase